MDEYLIASLLTHMEISSWSPATINHLDDISHSFVTHVIAVPTDEDTEAADHVFFHASLLHTDLRNAIHGPRIIFYWR